MVPIPKTPAVLRSEIRLKASGYAGWFILLEGDFDQRFWKIHLNALHLKLINCGGKPNVLGTLDLLTSLNQAQKIVALADKDYDKILSRLSQHPALFYTDENDLEVTLLRCTSSAAKTVMESILNVSVDANKRKIFEVGIGHSVVEHLRQMAANYGSLRLINEQLQLGVRFDNLPIQHHDFLDRTQLRQHEAALKNAFVNAVNQVGKVPLTLDGLTEKLASHQCSGLFSGWALVQGHDLVQLLSIAINSSVLKSDSGHQQASQTSLARDLCLSVHREHLQATGMFQKLSRQSALAQLSFFI